MKKTKINIEYPLNTKSNKLIWTLISTAEGLQKWIAGYVKEEDGRFVLTWGEAWTENHSLTAKILHREPMRSVKLSWENEACDEAYIELSIAKSDITGQQTLSITDYAEEGDEDNLRDLWEGDLERLHHSSGL